VLSSEDVIVFTCHQYTSEEKAEAEYFQQQTGILGDGFTMREGYATEFPMIPDARAQRRPEKDNRAEGLRRAKKRKTKLATAARRRNRR
jgi:hypothetical protein